MIPSSCTLTCPLVPILAAVATSCTLTAGRGEDFSKMLLLDNSNYVNGVLCWSPVSNGSVAIVPHGEAFLLLGTKELYFSSLPHLKNNITVKSFTSNIWSSYAIPTRVSSFKSPVDQFDVLA